MLFLFHGHSTYTYLYKCSSVDVIYLFCMHEIVKEKESAKEKGKIPNLFEKHDLFEDIDNIADLTIDQVKNLLEEEEKTNAKLKTDLHNQKDENIEKTRKISHVKDSPDRKVQSTKRKSKKEMQLEKMKDFLKDPLKGDDQEVNLDVRLKKTGGHLHFATDI